MSEITEISPSKELAYWVGVMQTDGCLTRYLDGNTLKHIARLEVSSKSLPMLTKFIDISSKLFNRTSKFCKYNTGKLAYKIGVNKFMSEFERLGIIFGKPPVPPNWCSNNLEFFGAYLAGVIDGDGNVHVQLNKRRFKKSYFQCRIRIFSKYKQNELKQAIEKLLNCNVNIRLKESRGFIDGRKFGGSCYDLQFLVSSKNFEIVERFMLPHISMPKKVTKISDYLNKLEIGNN